MRRSISQLDPENSSRNLKSGLKQIQQEKERHGNKLFTNPLIGNLFPLKGEGDFKNLPFPSLKKRGKTNYLLVAHYRGMEITPPITPMWRSLARLP